MVSHAFTCINLTVRIRILQNIKQNNKLNVAIFSLFEGLYDNIHVLIKQQFFLIDFALLMCMTIMYNYIFMEYILILHHTNCTLKSIFIIALVSPPFIFLPCEWLGIRLGTLTCFVLTFPHPLFFTFRFFLILAPAGQPKPLPSLILPK